MASMAASDFAVPSPDPSAAADRTDRASAVSSEMEAIFGGPAPRRERAPAAVNVERSPRAAGGRMRRKLPAASLGAIGAAALAGIAAGTLIVRRPATPTGPRHSAALPVVLVPPLETPQAVDAALAAPTQPAVTTPRPQPVVRLAPRQPTHHFVQAGSSYADARAADRRLRRAYAQAIRAGVPRALLAEDRDRWASVRRRYADQPSRLVASYDSLARDLDRAAAGPPRRTYAANRRGVFRFPWWR
jgi:hypothetical protein